MASFISGFFFLFWIGVFLNIGLALLETIRFAVSPG